MRVESIRGVQRTTRGSVGAACVFYKAPGYKCSLAAASVWELNGQGWKSGPLFFCTRCLCLSHVSYLVQTLPYILTLAHFPVIVWVCQKAQSCWLGGQQTVDSANPPASASEKLALWACVTTPGMRGLFFIISKMCLMSLSVCLVYRLDSEHADECSS